MAKFKITKRISLAELGDDWAECYLEFRQITFGEAKAFVGLDKEPEKAADKAIEILEDHFVSGKAVGEEGIVDVKAKDMSDFPAAVISQSITELVGKVEPNT